MVKYPNAAKGLKMIFFAQILSIIGAVVTVMITMSGALSLSLGTMVSGAVIGGIICIVASLIQIGGIIIAKKDELTGGYDKVFILTIVNIVLSFISMFLEKGTLESVISLVSNIITYVIFYYMCTTTSTLLRDVGDRENASRGDSVWNLTKICLIITGICVVLLFIPFINLLASLALIVVAVMAIVANILYLIFIYRSANSLSLIRNKTEEFDFSQYSEKNINNF